MKKFISTLCKKQKSLKVPYHCIPVKPVYRRVQWLTTKMQCSCTTYRLTCNFIYYIDTSVFLENTPQVKFIGNYIRDLSGIFSISSLMKILMISLMSSLSLKLYLNLLVYVRNSHLPVSLKSLRQSSEIFGIFGNV